MKTIFTLATMLFVAVIANAQFEVVHSCVQSNFTNSWEPAYWSTEGEVTFDYNGNDFPTELILEATIFTTQGGSNGGGDVPIEEVVAYAGIIAPYTGTMSFDPEYSWLGGGLFGPQCVTRQLLVNNSPVSYNGTPVSFQEGDLIEFVVFFSSWIECEAGSIDWSIHDFQVAIDCNQGCTYPDAINYDPAAMIDDNSCVFETMSSCPTDINYDGVTNIGDLVILLAEYGQECE